MNFNDGALTQISFDKVYRYLYVGDAPIHDADGKCVSNMAEKHGGVKVTFKKHLSDQADSYLEAEYGPIRRVTVTNASGEIVEANRTTDEGVVFVTSPPNLTAEPAREEIASNNVKHGLEAVGKVLQRADVKSRPRACAYWNSLAQVHGKGLVSHVPQLPCTVKVTKNVLELQEGAKICRKFAAQNQDLHIKICEK